jgi:hypothetical protein
VIFAINRRMIGANMLPAQREEAIEALSGDPLLPVVQVLVPAGNWVGHAPARRGIWGGLL